MAIIQAQPTAQPQSTFNSQAATIAQRKELAKALMAAQGQYNPSAEVSGYVVPTSGLQQGLMGLQTGLGAYLSASAAKQEAELKDKQTAMLAQALQSKTPDMGALAQSGMLSEDALVKALMEKGKTNREGVPTGFNPVEGGITPQNIVMPGGDPTNYMDYQVKLAKEKAQLPGYGDPERLQMSIEDQAAQRQNEARALAQQQQSNMMQQKNYELSLRAQERADKQANEADTEQSFTPGAIDNAAARYNMDGTLPPMGMGKTGALGRSAILNRAAELAQGISGGDQRVNQMGFKANSQALGQIQKQKTMVGSFERNANKNLDLALSLGNKVDRTGIPIINKWLQAGQKNFGDPSISAFHAANETFVNEYAKVMSGSMGNTAVSDSARQHAHELLTTVQSPEQYNAVANTLKQDMDNRMAGFDDEIGSLNQTMKSGNKINIDIKHPENLSPADREALNADIQKETGNAAPSSVPKIGSVEDGYVYIGGDPSKPESWKVQ